MTKAICILGIIGGIAIVVASFLTGLKADFNAIVIFYTLGGFNLLLAVVLWLIWDDMQ